MGYSSAMRARFVFVFLVVIVGCGDEDTTTRDLVQKQIEERRAHIEQLVRDGHLPPLARQLIGPDGSMNLDFINGPTDDVVRSGADGTKGKKLVWDLDRDGRIDRSERTITEQELYAATTR
jgi:hypothetical protein